MALHGFSAHLRFISHIFLVPLGSVAWQFLFGGILHEFVMSIPFSLEPHIFFLAHSCYISGQTCSSSPLHPVFLWNHIFFLDHSVALQGRLAHPTTATSLMPRTLSMHRRGNPNTPTSLSCTGCHHIYGEYLKRRGTS